MPKINRGYAIFGIYRNNLEKEDEAAGHDACICQYTRLHQIGRDFNAFEIFWHFTLRIYPALKKRVIKYTKRIQTALMKPGQNNPAPPDADAREFLHKDLKSGDLVRISSFPEISKTLDGSGRLKGLTFLAGMKPFCGEIATVQKEPLYLLDHGGRKVQKCKNIVICEKLYCDGTNIHCDRACLYYWKKDWLEDAP